MLDRAKVFTLFVVLLGARPGAGETVTLFPLKDNTLYEDVSGRLSNGSGVHFYVGRTFSPSLRRGLVAFDIEGGIPAGCRITGARLMLNVSRTTTLPPRVTVEIHRVTADWGEGLSNAGDLRGGDGGAAAPGDATWLHRFSPDATWGTPGGDLVPTASAGAMLGAVGRYDWESEGMVEDVQLWLDTPSTNFGWVLIGDEENDGTAKQFDSRENLAEGNRPELELDFERATGPGTMVPGDCTRDGVLDISDAVCLFGVLFLGSPRRFPCGSGTPGDPANIALLDWQPDGQVDLSDGIAMLTFLFGSGLRHPLAVPGRETTGCVLLDACPDLSASCR